MRDQRSTKKSILLEKAREWISRGINSSISAIFTRHTYSEWEMLHTKHEPVTSKEAATRSDDFIKNHLTWRTP